MTNILQLLLGLALVNYLMLDVISTQPKPAPRSAQLHKALAIAGTTAVAFLLTLAVSALVEQLVLFRIANPLLSTLSFILILAAVVQGIAVVLSTRQLPFTPAVGIFLPLIFTNCVAMGVTMPLDNSELADVFASGVARCTGFALVLVLFTMLRERLEGADVPAAFQGTPTTLFTAALLSITFMGFAGLG